MFAGYLKSFEKTLSMSFPVFISSGQKIIFVFISHIDPLLQIIVCHQIQLFTEICF